MANKHSHKKKKSTIFKIFLIPLIIIMMIQGIIAISMLIFRRTASTLEEYAVGMMSRLVENRKMILQNDMNQRWSSVYEQETVMNGILEQFLQSKNATLEQLLTSDAMKNSLLEEIFPKCLSFLQNNTTTGIFLILTNTDLQAAGEFDGFYIRDSDPNTSPANYTDMLLERGSKQLSRAWDIPLNTNWTTRFHMSGQSQNDAERYFYEPWRAGTEHVEAVTKDLGYWSIPFSLEKDTRDSYEMITYSLPLRYQNRVYGVLGVEISSRSLYDYFPVAELNQAQQSGYMLAVKKDDGSYMPLIGRGILYNRISALEGDFTLRETNHDALALVQEAKLKNKGIYTEACPLNLYSNNVPYDDTEWVFLGLNTEQELFGMPHQLYLWMILAILIGLIFGVFGIYFVVRFLTKPVQRLMQCISRGQAGLQEFKPSNILEIDALYDVVNELTARQKEAENILLEEKERYRQAIESTRDIFYSYDLQSKTLDIVNHETMSGQWLCEKSESGFINPDYIYEADQELAMQALQKDADHLYAEFRMRWPEETEFRWVALTGETIYDTDGNRWKVVGSIRDIQEQKEKEAEQLRKNTTDGVTGLYVFSAGLEQMKECRRVQPNGVMVVLFLGELKETNEKNGIVFGDMILEEIGSKLREACQRSTGEAGRQISALCLNRETFVLWLENYSGQQAKAFTEALLKDISASFEEEYFCVRPYAGLVHGDKVRNTEQLIRMALLAQSIAASGTAPQYSFYEELPAQEQAELPALQGQELNTLGYGKEVGLVSVALNLFGKGSDFPAQMVLMIRKIGRFYQASDVLVSLLRADFNSNYLDYQWHQNGKTIAESVRKYKEEEKNAFLDWLGQSEVCSFSAQDSRQKMIQCFLSVEEGQQGLLLPMYDSGNYMGNVCLLGIAPEILEDPEEYQNLAELGRVIQGQLSQQQHDIASKAKSEFLSRMSHEIRTPMNGIIGMTAIALQPDQSQERMTDCLQKIQSSSNYLLGLINDILDMSKIESGKMKLDPYDFNIDEMLDTVRELILPQAAAKEIALAENIELTHHCFIADKMRISQVLINLLGNAVKFTPPKGSVTLTVRETAVSDDKAAVYFAVSDTGIGISKEDQDRVFRSFEQAAGRDPSKSQGTGLGLSISSRLVQLMGSNIQLDSEPGKGSVFSFSVALPLGEETSTAVQQEEISFAGRRVLVVEDNELNAEIAQCLLEERDFEVECVYNGAQAVERIRSTEPGRYDVILMDIMMPVMDGLEAARTIRSMEREDCHTIPIIAMSANAFDDDLKKSVECGMNGHLSKPVEVDKLYQMLDEAIRNKKE